MVDKSTCFMKRCAYCGRENEDSTVLCSGCGTPFAELPAEEQPEPDVLVQPFPRSRNPQWLRGFLVLMALLTAVGLYLGQRARRGTVPRIIIRASWLSNGQQFVTFRLTPPTAEVTYADLLPSFADGNVQPETVRNGIPVRGTLDGTNYSLRFVALPVRSGPMPGRPLVAFTPGSYTIAYSPTEDGCRVRAGVASARTGIADYLGRLRSSWEHKNLAWLLPNSHEDPSFVVLDPITNTFPATTP